MFDFIVKDAAFMCVTSENGKHWTLTTHHPPERIVKCKDCKYSDGVWCDIHERRTDWEPDGFCAWGDAKVVE